MTALPQVVSAVTVSAPVDGTDSVDRRPSTGDRRRWASTVECIKVDPRVWQAARTALRENERILIVSAECVRTVYRKEG